MNKNEINEINDKVNYLDGLLKKNLFQNPVREVQVDLRNDLLDFRTSLLKNLSKLDNYLV